MLKMHKSGVLNAQDQQSDPCTDPNLLVSGGCHEACIGNCRVGRFYKSIRGPGTAGVHFYQPFLKRCLIVRGLPVRRTAVNRERVKWRERERVVSSKDGDCAVTGPTTQAQ